MSKVHYLKDSKKFWETHEKAREARNKRLARLPFSKKAAITEKLQIDCGVLRNAKEQPEQFGLGKIPLEAANKLSIEQSFTQNDFEEPWTRHFLS